MFFSVFFNLYKFRSFFLEVILLVVFCDQNDKTMLSYQIEKNKKIIIYGFGPYGEEYFVKLFRKCQIKGIYDINFEEFNSRYILCPNLINKEDFDYVVITVMNPEARKSVVEFFFKKGISLEKIVFVNYKKSMDEHHC